jgi:WD40 repeat protein
MGVIERAQGEPAMANEVSAVESTISPVPTVVGGVETVGSEHIPPLPVRDERPLPRVEGYEVLEELGQGGMGIVFKARHLGLKRVVALKMLQASAGLMGRDWEQLAVRLRREAEALARLRHPHIVEVYDIGETSSGSPFLALEYCSGGSLDHQLDGTPWQPRRAALLVRTLAQAMHAAHTANVIHRDLKPGNVLLSGSTGCQPVAASQAGSLCYDIVPKITDFGLAKKLDEAGQTQSGTVVGTPSYMAPEQAQGKVHEIGPAADIYALGAILYELLTGRPPFKAATALDTLMQVVREEPVPLRRLNAAVPIDLETVCLRCLHKEPGNRYPSASELADDLQRWLDSEPIHARPVGTLERAVKWARRRPAAAVLLAALLVVGLVGVALALSLVDRAATARQMDVVRSEKANAERYRAEAERLSALLIFKNGAGLCEQGDAGRGMLLLAQALEKCPASAPDLERAIRTALPSAAVKLHTLEKVFPFPNHNVIAALGPGGRTLLLGGGKEACLVDVATGRARPLAPSAGNLYAGAFRANGKLLVTATDKGVIRFADPATGKDIGPNITHKGAVKSVVFSPDGETILVSAQLGESLRCYSVTTRRPLPPVFDCKDYLYIAAYSPDGRLVATAAKENRACLHDARTGQLVGKPLVHPGVVFTAAFSPDGKTLATGCLDGGVRFWDVKTGNALPRILRHRASVRSTAFSRDGRLVLTSSEDGTARLWEVATGRPVGQLLSHPAEMRHALFNPQHTHILTAGLEGTARLWRLAREDSLARVLPHHGAVAEIAFSPDGMRVLTGCQESKDRPGESRLWDAATGKALGPAMSQHGQVMGVAFSPDGQLALTGGNDGHARLWRTADSSPARAPWKYDGNVVAAVAFSPDGRLAAFGGRGRTVQVREVASGKQVAAWPVFDKAGWVWRLTFTPDGQRVLVVGGDSSARMWNVADGRPVGQAMKHAADVRLALLSPDAEVVLTCGFDKTARLWSARDGRPLSPPLPHKGEVRGGAFRPDGQVAATAAADGTVRLWEVPSGRSLAAPLLHDGWVRAVAFSPDGKMLATGCDDGTARLWSADDGAALGAVLQHQGPVTRVAFCPDGKTILTGSSDGTARLWTPPRPVAGDPEHVRLWAQVLTGMELDGEGTVRVLPGDVWQERRRQLEERGGPPRAGS